MRALRCLLGGSSSCLFPIRGGSRTESFVGAIEKAEEGVIAVRLAASGEQEIPLQEKREID